MLAYYDILRHILYIIKDYSGRQITENDIKQYFYRKFNMNEEELTQKEKDYYSKKIKKALNILQKLNYVKTMPGDYWFITKKINNVIYEEDNNENIGIEEIINVAKKSDAFNGIAISLTLILFSLFLYFNPCLMEEENLAFTFAILFLITGIMGLGFEIDRLIEREEKPVGLFNIGSNLGVGLFLGAVISYIWYNFHIHNIANWLINLIFILLLFLPVYGVILAIINLIYRIIIDKDSVASKLVLKVPLFIIQIASALLVIVQIMSLFGVSLF